MESPVKAITAMLGLLTAIVVLFGAITDQGWLPSFVKGPVQAAVPGQQPSESDGDGSGPTDGGPTNGGPTNGGQTKPPEPPPTVDPDTCIQGYVWREAVPDDRVCVTPQMRDQVQEDNRLAESRRSPTGGAYGPNTCLQGYVWREAVPSDLVCVTPEMRDEVRADNQLAASRRVG